MEEKHVKTKTVIEQIYKNKKNKERIDNAAGGGGMAEHKPFCV